MRKLVVISCIFLIVSGIVLAFPEWFSWAEGSSATSLLHIWVGFFFLVIFPLYAWDHIRGHTLLLREISGVTFSGMLQLLAGLGLVFSGIPLLLYEKNAVDFPRQIHLALTFVLAGSLILHKFKN